MALPVLSRCLCSRRGDVSVKTSIQVEPSQGFMRRARGRARAEATASLIAEENLVTRPDREALQLKSEK